MSARTVLRGWPVRENRVRVGRTYAAEERRLILRAPFGVPGRAVAANVIARYGLDPDQARQDYVRKIGASIVALSDHLHGNYGGYHFAVLADPKPNGVSGPGGFVFITRGALDLCRSEDEVAGILAHELAHVAAKHGEAIIRKSRELTITEGDEP